MRGERHGEAGGARQVGSQRLGEALVGSAPLWASAQCQTTPAQLCNPASRPPWGLQRPHPQQPPLTRPRQHVAPRADQPPAAGHHKGAAGIDVATLVDHRPGLEGGVEGVGGEEEASEGHTGAAAVREGVRGCPSSKPHLAGHVMWKSSSPDLPPPIHSVPGAPSTHHMPPPSQAPAPPAPGPAWPGTPPAPPAPRSRGLPWTGRAARGRARARTQSLRCEGECE